MDCNWTKGDEGRKYFSDRIQEDSGCTLVALVDGNIVGYLVGGMVVEPESYRTIPQMAELENMYTLEEVRSRGIGTKLSQKFTDWSKEKGAKRLKVVASAQNQRAIDFYKRNGFEDYNLTLERDL